MDPLTIIMVVVLIVLVFFMFRNSRKRQRDQAELRSKIGVGADVMTNFGLYGRILELDEETNEVLLETTPGTVLKLHRQVIARVVEPKLVESDTDEVEAEPSADQGEPEFGERITDERPHSAKNE